MLRKFLPCEPCCNSLPLIVISTFDSSVDYSYLCTFEGDGSGCPDNNAPGGDCVFAPTIDDIETWTEHNEAFTDLREENERTWPIAGGCISGGFRCYAGVKEALWPEGEPWVEDTYGEWEFSASGTDSTARMSLEDLQDMFTTLYEKHGFNDDNGKAGFLFIVDDTGSIRLSQWPEQVKEDFLDWVEETYPRVEIREELITDFIAQGEDWLRIATDFYQDIIDEGF